VVGIMHDDEPAGRARPPCRFRGGEHVAVAIYRHPSDASCLTAAELCVVSTPQGWFEVDCRPGAGGWRLRLPYFGPRVDLAPVTGARALALRDQLDYPGWLEMPEH
jgi:hypothetical protein